MIYEWSHAKESEKFSQELMTCNMLRLIQPRQRLGLCAHHLHTCCDLLMAMESVIADPKGTQLATCTAVERICISLDDRVITQNTIRQKVGTLCRLS
jgi:hypothetical protein